MPYIKPENRHILLESTIHELMATNFLSAGDLNFVISSLLWKQFNKDKRYDTANMLIGVLECCKQELYRTQIAPYEHEKLLLNGDLEL